MRTRAAGGDNNAAYLRRRAVLWRLKNEYVLELHKAVSRRVHLKLDSAFPTVTPAAMPSNERKGQCKCGEPENQ